MDVSVVLDTRGAATAGVDRNALVANIQAELDKVAQEAKSNKSSPVAEAPPTNAQGDPTTLHWLLHIAGDPAMAKVYAQGLAFAINSLLSSAQSKQSTSSEDGGKTNGISKDTGIVNIKVLGKDILLPATTAAIQIWLQSFGSQ